MFVSGWIVNILVGLTARIGLDQLLARGYFPQSTYIRSALKALERDVLDEAVRKYRLSLAKKKPSDCTAVVHEIISGAIAIRRGKLLTRIRELEQALNPPVLSVQFWRNLIRRLRRDSSELESLRAEHEGCQAAIEVLDRMQKELDKG